jgi:hypothetical protein
VTPVTEKNCVDTVKLFLTQVFAGSVGSEWVAVTQWPSGCRTSPTSELAWHPISLAQPHHAATQKQSSTEPVHGVSGSTPNLSCGSPLRQAGGMRHPPPPSRSDSCARPSRRRTRPARAPGAISAMQGAPGGKHFCVNADWPCVRVPESVVVCR